jgi:Straboviridae baseplate wedge protein Gp6
MADIVQSDFIDFTETDFQQLKTNLIEYITNQSEFTDQNTEGSNFNLVSSLLAYLSEILGFNLNSVINERFINTAKLRTNILKLLKTLNYTPYRKQSSQIYLDLYVPYDVDKRDYYLTTYDSVKSGNYIFYYIGADKYPEVYVQPITGIKYLKYTECLFAEGQLVVSGAETFNIRTGEDVEETNEFYVGTNKDYQTFDILDQEMGSFFKILQNKNNEIIEWDIFDEKQDYVNASLTELFFLEEIDNGYQLEFGNNKLGKAPEDTDTLGYVYIRPTGIEANELNTFTFNNGEYLSDTDFGTSGFIEPPDSDDFMQLSYGGGDKETLEEIKFTAPKFHNTQSRAVTEEDYKTIALRHPLIEKANVIGGQKVISKQTSGKMLGKVYIYVKPDIKHYPNLEFSDNILDNILKTYFKEYSVVTIDPIVNNVNYIFYLPYIELKYVSDKAPNEEDIKQILDDYMANEQGQFGEYFEESKFIEQVGQSDALINSVVFNSEKYIEIDNGTYIDNPNNFEFKTVDVPEQRTNIYKFLLSKNLQKWKIDLRQKITKLEYNFLDYDYNGIELPTLTGDLSELIVNPFYGRRVPATRLETYVYQSVDNVSTPLLTYVSFPFNHPGINANYQFQTGEDIYMRHYYLMYGENPVATSTEFYPEEAGRLGELEDQYLYDKTVNFYSKIFNWSEEEFNYGESIDGVTYDRPVEEPGSDGNLTLFAGTEFVSETGEPNITNLFPALDFSNLQNYEDIYPHNIVSFLPHLQDRDVAVQNNEYRSLDYWMVMGENVSTNNVIKYKREYHEVTNDPNDRYWMKLYLDEGDQINVNQYNFDTESTEITTLNTIKDEGRLFSELQTGELTEEYYCLIETPSFKQNMLFKIIDVGKEKLVTSEGNVEEFSINVIGNKAGIDPGITSYITFTTIDISGNKYNNCLWFNTGSHLQPNTGSDNYLEVDISSGSIITAQDIANTIDIVLTQTGDINGVDFGTSAYNYNGNTLITLVNEGNGIMSINERIDTNDYETFQVNRDVEGQDDEITTEQLSYVKLEHVTDPNTMTSFTDQEIQEKLIYHNENYETDPQTGDELNLDFLANLLEDFNEVRADQTYTVYRRVKYNSAGDGLPDLIPDPNNAGEFIENTDLVDGELIQVLGIHQDFNGIYRISNNGTSYNWLKTDIKIDTNISSNFSSEIPYLTGSYTLELPGKLDKEPKKTHRFHFEVQEYDVVLHKDQIIDLKQDDIDITTTKVIIDDTQDIS